MVPKPYVVGEEAEFVVLRGVLSGGEVAELVAIGSKVLSGLISSGHAREKEVVDGLPAFATDIASRGEYGPDLGSLLQPLVERRLAPHVRQRYGCPGAALATATLRRYVPEERRFLPPHHDHHAFASVVLGLQGGPEGGATGGFFVQGSGRAFLDRRFVPLCPGDVAVHQSDLHHGVDVQDGSLLYITLFFADSKASAASGACPWYHQPAARGDASAQYSFALSLQRKGDHREAQEWLDKACSQDHPEALFLQAELAFSPPVGSGQQPDTAKALQFFRRAAELGHGHSQSRLGGLLSNGVQGRVQQDTWEGKRLLRLSFEQDDADASYHLGNALLQEGDREGVTKLLAACAKGHPAACFNIGLMYRDGQYNLPKDPPQSLRFTKWAAHMGEAQALSNLGHMLMTGNGVIKDEAKAARLFRRAAEADAPEGLMNWALCLLRGNGGTRVDYRKACDFAQRSAAMGHQMAQEMLPTFFSAARNPNPPARPMPTSVADLQRLGVKELRDFLQTEGVDFSDCIEKADLVSRAAIRLPGAEEPWDPAPEHAILLEPKKRPHRSAATGAQPVVAQAPMPAADHAHPTSDNSAGTGGSRGHALPQAGAGAATSAGRSPVTTASAPHAEVTQVASEPLPCTPGRPTKFEVLD